MDDKEVQMALQLRLPNRVIVLTDPRTFCPACSGTMAITMVATTLFGTEMRTYACPCGHSESVNVRVG